MERLKKNEEFKKGNTPNPIYIKFKEKKQYQVLHSLAEKFEDLKSIYKM